MNEPRKESPLSWGAVATIMIAVLAFGISFEMDSDSHKDASAMQHAGFAMVWAVALSGPVFLIFVLPALVRLTWGAFLRRTNEVSRAVQGKLDENPKLQPPAPQHAPPPIPPPASN
jgi:hypothetical protein